MNTIVFVLMAYTHSSNWVPTIEFSTLEKCERAVEVLHKGAEAHQHPISFAMIKRGYCERIEK